MKYYYCKVCETTGKNKKFTGTRNDVRKHIREEHKVVMNIKEKMGSGDLQ